MKSKFIIVLDAIMCVVFFAFMLFNYHNNNTNLMIVDGFIFNSLMSMFVISVINYKS